MAPSGPKRSVRANQPAAQRGMGVHFTSPLKRADTRKKHVARGLGHAMKVAELRSRLEARLLGDPIPLDGPPSSTDAPSPQLNPEVEPQSNGDANGDAEWIDDGVPPALPPPLPATGAHCTRLFNSWERLLPLLEAPFAAFYSSTHAQQRPMIPPQIKYRCTVGCNPRTKVVKCLYPLGALHRASEAFISLIYGHRRDACAYCHLRLHASRRATRATWGLPSFAEQAPCWHLDRCPGHLSGDV
jgi:hypothetical protein